MDNKFKVGDRVRIKTREQIKEAATLVSETYINGKLDEYSYEFLSGFCFINEMEHLCGFEAYITDMAEDNIKLKFSQYNPYKNHNWTYTPEMLELVEENKPQYEQMSFDDILKLKEKMENLKPVEKQVDIQIVCLDRICNDLEKELSKACEEFEQFKTEGIETIKECKEALNELKEKRNESLK